MHPFVLTLALLCALGVVRHVVRKFTRRTFGTAVTGIALVVVSLMALMTYAAVAVFYATDPHYFDAVEPVMTAIGWLFHVAQPVYHALDSAERYSQLYGPTAFIAQGLALGMFGPSIEVSKWVGASFALVSLALTFGALRTQTTTRRALIITGVSALLMLGFRNYSFWTRAEPLLIFCVSAGLFVILRGRGNVSGVPWGVLAGLLWNLKATGFIYSLPLFVMLGRRAGWRRAFLSAAVAVGVAALPFIAFDNVSFTHYLAWLRLSANHGLVWSLFTRNLEWAAYFLTPVVLARLLKDISAKDDRLVTLMILASTGVIAIVGSKAGAGPYHLLPLLPLFGFLGAACIGRQRTLRPPAPVQLALASFVAVAIGIAAVQQMEFVTTMQARRHLHEIRDIESFVSQHPGVVEMGYGVDQPLSFERPVLVFRNNAYLLDAPAVGDHQLGGLAVPPATIDALRTCRVNYWLVPKGEAPFTAVNMYPAVYPATIFSGEFRRAFHETHERITTTEYFDVWQCHGRR